MNKRVKKKWLEALRGGEYKQGRGELEKDGKYCCLGVLTDLYCKAKRVKKKVKERLLDDVIPPKEVVEWADLGVENPVVMKGDKTTSLVGLNDGEYAGNPQAEIRQHTFKQIAKVIEEQL